MNLMFLIDTVNFYVLFDYQLSLIRKYSFADVPTTI